MSQPGKILVAVEIDIISKKSGTGFDATVTGYRVLTGETEAAGQAAKQATGYYQSQSYAVRRLALDLRMMSIGLMILKREYGGLNPILDAGITAMYTFSAATSVAMGSVGILTRSYTLLKKAAGEGGTAMQGLSKIIGALPGGIHSVIIALGALIAIALGTAAFEWGAGISKLRVEIRELKRDLEDLESGMRNIQVANAELSEETAYYQMQLAKLNREIELQGAPTKAQEQQVKSLEARIRDLSTANTELAWAQARQQTTILQTTDIMKDAEEQITATYRAAGKLAKEGILGAAGPLMTPPIIPGVPEAQIGAEVKAPGLLYVHRGEIVESREQRAEGMAVDRGGGPISIAISFPGATFATADDIVSALRRGGAEAGEEANRRLELMRRGVRSRR